MGYLLIVIKTITNISESIFIKKYNTKHTAGGMFFTGILSVFALLFFAISDRDGLNFPKEMIPYALCFGLIYCIAFLTTFVALIQGSFTLSMLIISYSLIFPILYGILFLHESITAFTCIGFGLLMVSIFLVRGRKETTETKFSAKWLIAILITTVGNGLLAILQKVEQIKFHNSCNNEFMMVALAFSAIVLLVGGIIKDHRHLKEILRYGIPYAGLAGFANGINNLLGIYVNNLLPLSIVSPANAGIKILLTFVISRVLFKERYLKRQIVGVIIGTAALVFLNL